MNPEKLNQWLTLLANFGVIAGLVFLGLEIQQNTTAVRASAIQESTNVARQQILTYATDAELNRLNMANFDDLTNEEQQRVFWASRSFWIGMQGLFGQWRMGVLPDDDWSMWHKIICLNYTPDSAGFNENLFSAAFVEFVQSCEPVGFEDRTEQRKDQ